jgi:hypothetical protein
MEKFNFFSKQYGEFRRQATLLYNYQEYYFRVNTLEILNPKWISP